MITGVGIADIFSNGVIVRCPQDEMIRKTLNQVAVALYYYFFKYYDTLSKNDKNILGKSIGKCNLSTECET